jgi:predicted RND superfamily exporter protein
MLDVESLLERADEWIVERSRVVVVAFLVVTVVLAGGMGKTATESGTDQFVEGNPSQEAFEEISEKFGGPSFQADTGGTQLIQKHHNVLSKPALLRMLTVQERVSEREALRVSSTGSAASMVALQLDPDATTLEAKQRAIERATPSEIDAAVRRAAETPGFTSLLSDDFNAQAASASATIGSISHEMPGGLSSSSGTSGDSPLLGIQVQVADIAEAGPGDITVFGSGIVADEFSSVIGDSLAIVVPLAGLLIVVFLIYAYRDPVDLVLGIVALVMTMIWTFGFMGWAGIPFGQMLITIPVLLLAVGIDFGIHAVNRYREERVEGHDARTSMRTATDQLLVAFFIVTGTTVLGFSANLVSDLGPIQNFGLVASIGIVFTFLIFGVFLPAAKLYADEVRERHGIPLLAQRPIGNEDSYLGKILPAGVVAAKRAPKAFLLCTLLISVAAAGYGTGVDTSFSQEDFLPPSEQPAYLDYLPGPLQPGEYTVTQTLNFLEDNFESSQNGGVLLYVEAPLTKADSLEQIHQTTQNPPSSFVSTDREASTQSIITVIQSYAERDPDFRALVDRSDLNDNGVPDKNLEAIYDSLLASPVRGQALQYITEDYRATQIVFSTESDASADAVTADGKAVAAELRLGGVATGETIVFQAISDVIFASAINSLAIALTATAIFLVLIYWALEGQPSLGLVNLVPIVVAIALLAGTMRLFDIPFNALTATILSIAIGLGIDYSAHIVHRFAEEYDQTGNLNVSLDNTIRGTGGALTGSMLTTSAGTAVLVLAITPILGQFGLLISLSVFYSFLTAVVVTPSAIVLWERYTQSGSTVAVPKPSEMD